MPLEQAWRPVPYYGISRPLHEKCAGNFNAHAQCLGDTNAHRGNRPGLVRELLNLPVRVEQKPTEAERADLRARCGAIVAACNAPLPGGDVGLVEAERRLSELSAAEDKWADYFNITYAIDKEIEHLAEPARNRLVGFIEELPRGRLLVPLSNCG